MRCWYGDDGSRMRLSEAEFGDGEEDVGAWRPFFDCAAANADFRYAAVEKRERGAAWTDVVQCISR